MYSPSLTPVALAPIKTRDQIPPGGNSIDVNGVTPEMEFSQDEEELDSYHGLVVKCKVLRL